MKTAQKLNWLDILNYLWHKTCVPIFIERFLLPVLATLVVAVIIVNPMGMDNIQKVTLGLGVICIALFLAQTLHKYNESKETTNEPKPQVEIIWNKDDATYLMSHSAKKDGELPTYKVFIGVRNYTDQTIENLRVQIEYVRSGEIEARNIPLREKNSLSSYEQSYILNPKAELFFYIGECDSNRVFRVFSAIPDAQPLELGYNSNLSIAVDGKGISPIKRDLLLMWKKEGLITNNLPMAKSD